MLNLQRVMEATIDGELLLEAFNIYYRTKRGEVGNYVMWVNDRPTSKSNSGKSEGDFVPHFHIGTHTRTGIVTYTCLCLLEARYFDHDKSYGPIIESEFGISIKDIDKFLRMKYVKDKSITNWEAMVNYWYLNHDGEKPDYLEQPDYKNSVCWRDK